MTDPEHEVVLSSDPEGNSYDPLYFVKLNMYFDTEDRYVFSEKEREEEGYPTENCIKAFVLWP
jgi:hypothetical protein